jgi:hypothetical protein
MSEPVESDFDVLVQALGQLQPTPVKLPRDQLLFEAGQAALAGKLHRWRWLCGVSAVCSVGLFIALMVQYTAPPTIRYVVVPQPPVAVPPVNGEMPGSPSVPPRQTTVPETQVPVNAALLVQQQILRTGELPTPVEDAEPEPLPHVPPRVVPTAWQWFKE